ncbi:ComEC/Rec2 family competence protein [Streptomyces sp. NBRC 110028]|uniref:ComEC/Rec2 family competence protein n=1 Tax=Streptomyces sp. NBRC 110028 TaxID=1621260 RepID=UPI0006E25CC7|nr:MBL fold metallo-hydrolase [Streptomyces sp. NBRC 110028]
MTDPTTPTELALSQQTEADLAVTVLDVGHGNSAVVRDGSTCAVIDAAPGDIVQRELDRVGCGHIEHLIISHSDQDHAGGGPQILLDPLRTVGTAWFNPDAKKNSRIWERLIRAVHTRHRRGGFGGHQMLHTETPQTLHCGRARLEVCHPSFLMAGTGPTETSPTFGKLDTNTVSIVVRVHLEEEPAVLLAADMDAVALKHIQENGHQLSAPVLVFPHHGGLPGKADPQSFAKALTELVAPRLVIFSIRGGLRPANPHREIMAGVRLAAPDAHIACTQLSVHCHEEKQLVTDRHLAVIPAAGRKSGRSCAGSVTVTRVEAGLRFDPPLETHRSFVDSGTVISPLCRLPIPGPRKAPSNVGLEEAADGT